MSRRESILTAIVSALQGTTQVGNRIYRSRMAAFQRGEAPAITVEPLNDTATQTLSLPRLDWRLLVRVAIIVRGHPPDQLADPIVTDMHAKLMADLTLGGYAIDIQPQGVTFEMADGDQGPGVVLCDYLVQYRTSVANLET
jgi:hypothetical protein